MFPACTADHNCCGVAETFFGCCTSEEECAFEAARAGATAAWLAPSGCSAFAGCGVADGDDVRVIRSVEDAPAVCGLCLCGDPVGRGDGDRLYRRRLRRQRFGSGLRRDRRTWR